MGLFKRFCPVSFIAFLCFLALPSIRPPGVQAKSTSKKPPSPNASIIVEKNLFSQSRHYTPPLDETDDNDPWKQRIKREILVHGIYEIDGHRKALLKISRALADKWGINTDSRGFIRVGEGDSLGNFTVKGIGKDYVLINGDGKYVKLLFADYARKEPPHITHSLSTHKERRGKKYPKRKIQKFKKLKNKRETLR